MNSRAYRATHVNDVKWDEIACGREGCGVTLGVDVGKHSLWAVCRWADGRFERPWRSGNPMEIPSLVSLIKRMSMGRKLVVAMESSGTYGDSLRQALADKEIKLERVSNKASHDYAEVFDGVPSQHDGKDAAVVAELAGLGKSTPWDYRPADAWEEELAYWVEWMVAQRLSLTIWQGRLEGLVGRHWPEATRVLKLSSATLLRALRHYGCPQALAADPQAAQQLARWGGKFLKPEKVKKLVDNAGSSVGVRAGEWQRRQIQDYAQQALATRAEGQRAERRAAPSGCRAPCAPISRQGSGRAHGVRVVDEHGRPADISRRSRVSQGDGLESGGAEQRPVQGATADQQTGQRSVSAVALFRGAASDTAVWRASLVRGKEGSQ